MGVILYRFNCSENVLDLQSNLQIMLVIINKLRLIIMAYELMQSNCHVWLKARHFRKYTWCLYGTGTCPLVKLTDVLICLQSAPHVSLQWFYCNSRGVLSYILSCMVNFFHGMLKRLIHKINHGLDEIRPRS